MRRITPIRITKNDAEEYKRLVRNTKAKISRADKKYGKGEYLASEIDLPSLESFKERGDFNEWKDRIKVFNNRANTKYQFKKNKHGVVASKKEIAEIERNTKLAQKKADKLIKEAENKPFFSGDKQHGTVGQQMKQMGRPNAAGIKRPPDFNFDDIKTEKRLNEKKKNMEDRASGDLLDRRMTTMKKNFLENLMLSMHSDADELVERLSEVPANDFYEMYLMFDEFDFALYPSDGSQLNGEETTQHITRMMSYVDRFYKGKVNMDMKNF